MTSDDEEPVEAVPAPPNAAGGLWIVDPITKALTPVVADVAPLESPPSDDE